MSVTEEKIYKKPNGGLVLVAISSVGIHNAVDFSDVYRESARRYELGSGWPKNPPPNLGNETVWDFFKK